MADTQELQLLAPENIKHLLKVLENLLPDSAIVYYSIKTQLCWAKEDPGIQIIILCPNGNWSDGQAVQLTAGLGDKIFGTIYAPEGKEHTLKSGVLSTNLIDWDKIKLFTAVPNRLTPLLDDILRIKKFRNEDSLRAICHMHVMSVDDAKKVALPTLPEKVIVRLIEKTELEMVCQNWDYYDPEFRPFVEKMIDLNPTAAVFVKNDQGQEEIASMVLQSEYGGIGLLHTVPKFRRRGYAEIALAHLTRTLGHAGVMPFGYSLTTNEKSATLFKKLGYRVHGLATDQHFHKHLE